MRHHDLKLENLDEDQATLYKKITNGPRGQHPSAFNLVKGNGALAGPFGLFLLSPTVGDSLQRLGVTIRYESSLPDRLREIACLVLAYHLDSDFQIHAHEAIASSVGINREQCDATGAKHKSIFDDVKESACLEISRALVNGDVDDDTWARCVPPLTTKEVFELVTAVGYYSTLSLQMRVLATG